jgi:tRNA(fMet)-specific endonuclease VapC
MDFQGYLLDTNIAIAALIHDDEVNKFIVEARREGMNLFFSIITQCEVLSGAKSEFEWKRLSKLFSREICLEADRQIAESASLIRYQQRLKKRKIKTSDALIIATALEYELALVSRDSDMHFVQEELDIPLVMI